MLVFKLSNTGDSHSNGIARAPDDDFLSMMVGRMTGRVGEQVLDRVIEQVIEQVDEQVDKYLKNRFQTFSSHSDMF